MTYAQQRSCARKARYSKAQARRRADRIMQRDHKRVAAYKCRYCGGWHLTSATQEDET